MGTGHVFDIGHVVERIIDERGPDVVCVELDPVRLRGLQERRQLSEMEAAGDPRVASIKAKQAEALKRLPFVYRLLARVQERIAGDQGVEAGNEMLAAVDAANRRGIPAACIDVDAQNLIKRAWGQMGLGERFRFLWAMWRGGSGDKTVDDEMSSYQDDPVAYLASVGDQFPTLKRVLIDERDTHMSRGILAMKEHAARLPSNPETVRVVAVVGDGHVAGMLKHLEGQIPEATLEVIRVKALRDGTLPEPRWTPRQSDSSQHIGEDGESGVRISYNVDLPEDNPE